MNDFEKFEPVPKARFTINFIDGVEWAVSRASKNWFVIPFLVFWLTGWTTGGIAAITQFLSGDAEAFLALWLVGWAIGWLFAVSWLGWQFSGRLQISVQGRALVYRWSMLLFSKTKRYDVQQIRNLRAGSQSWPMGSRFMNSGYPPFLTGMAGSVQFDYGGRTINVMPGLDQAEGQAIADWLGHRIR